MTNTESQARTTTRFRTDLGMQRGSALAPVVTRIIVGGLMFAHGLDKVSNGTAGVEGFGQFLASEGAPVSLLLAWGVTLLELVGGPMLILGLLARPVAALMIVELLLAVAMVTGANGLIAAGPGVGYERDLAYIMGLLVVVLLGPGRPSADHALGLEVAPARPNAD